MFTGNHPFGGESFSSLIHKVINEDPFPMKNFQSSTPDVLEKIVLKALGKSPERRYRNGFDFASDLSTLFSHLERPQSDISFQEKFNYARELDFFGGSPILKFGKLFGRVSGRKRTSANVLSKKVISTIRFLLSLRAESKCRRMARYCKSCLKAIASAKWAT